MKRKGEKEKKGEQGRCELGKGKGEREKKGKGKRDDCKGKSESHRRSSHV